MHFSFFFFIYNIKPPFIAISDLFRFIETKMRGFALFMTQK